MPTKAVFLDWYNTLARREPPTEALHMAACRSYGIFVDPQRIVKGVSEADRFFYEENARSRIDKRLPADQVEFHTQYEDIVLKEAGVELPRAMGLPIWMKVRELSRGANFVLFDEVMPVLQELRDRSMITALISNMQQDMAPLLARLGLVTAIDYIVSSADAGADKPDPRIFQHALALARVEPREAIHVGDQYYVDVAGARAAGIRPVLLDRYDIHGDADCERIHSLAEIPAIL